MSNTQPRRPSGSRKDASPVSPGAGRSRMKRLSGMGPSVSRMQFSQIPGLTFLHPAAGGNDSKLIIWTESEKRTPFAPALLERMARLNILKLQHTKLIDRTRNCAQPNRAFRGERLVPSAMNLVSDRVHYASAIRECTAFFDNSPELQECINDLVQLELQIEQLHDTFLRQVMIFSVKPCRQFLDEHVPQVSLAYAELEKRRDRFDQIRKKNPTDARVLVARQEFVEQAHILAALLDEMPARQMAFAKAIDMFVRGEAAFCLQALKLTDKFKPPDHPSRWGNKPTQ